MDQNVVFIVSSSPSFILGFRHDTYLFICVYCLPVCSPDPLHSLSYCSIMRFLICLSLFCYLHQLSSEVCVGFSRLDFSICDPPDRGLAVLKNPPLSRFERGNTANELLNQHPRLHRRSTKT